MATPLIDFRNGPHLLVALTADVSVEDPVSGMVIVFRGKRAQQMTLYIESAIGEGCSSLASAVGHTLQVSPFRRGCLPGFREFAKNWLVVNPNIWMRGGCRRIINAAPISFCSESVG